jgi:hypothetical protein
VYFVVFLDKALDRGKWVASRSGFFVPGDSASGIRWMEVDGSDKGGSLT